MPDIGPWELILILVVVVLLFGSAKLPQLARSLGQAKGEFEKGMRDGKDKNKDPEPSDKKEEA
jgi:sec-independent protein translocase protein TatA